MSTISVVTIARTSGMSRKAIRRPNPNTSPHFSTKHRHDRLAGIGDSRHHVFSGTPLRASSRTASRAPARRFRQRRSARREVQGSSRAAPGRRVQTSTLVSETPSFRATSRRRSSRTALLSSRMHSNTPCYRVSVRMIANGHIRASREAPPSDAL
jgi:hypothetical protein